MRPSAPFLLDVTRLISRSWTRRRSTGIDRVCYAYLDHYRERSHAIVQYKGMFLVLTRQDSRRLYELLAGPDESFRRALAAFAPKAFARGRRNVDGAGSVYLNVSHTDFDLDSHWLWAQSSNLHTVYLIHDLIPINHAEHCRPHAVNRHRGRVVKALQGAGGIIVNSKATAGDLAEFSRQQASRLPPVVVAPLAGADLKLSGGPLPLEEPYFLCLGTIEPRKNHQLLLKVWKRLAKGGGKVPHLVCIGQWGANSDPVRHQIERDPDLRRHVTVLDYCSDDMLGDWIGGAQALLMPSLAEGFGLPLVEALALGTPVVASDLACFRETGQGLPILLDPTRCDDWERMVRRLATDPQERSRHQVSTRTFCRPTWQQHFNLVDLWLAETVGQQPARTIVQVPDLAPTMVQEPALMLVRNRNIAPSQPATGPAVNGGKAMWRNG